MKAPPSAGSEKVHQSGLPCPVCQEATLAVEWPPAADAGNVMVECPGCGRRWRGSFEAVDESTTDPSGSMRSAAAGQRSARSAQPEDANPATFLDEHGDPRAFVIVASARSGSNLLSSYFRQVPGVACFGEVLGNRAAASPEIRRLTERYGLKTDVAKLHQEDLTAFWELLISKTLERKRWAGAKAFYWHRRSDPVWQRFTHADHRVIHLWRDKTFESYVSLQLAHETGEWSTQKAKSGATEAKVHFDRDKYLRFRKRMQADVIATRRRFDVPGRYSELEYSQLTDHEFVENLLESLFGEQINVEEWFGRQRRGSVIDRLSNAADAEPFQNDSLEAGFATPEDRS